MSSAAPLLARQRRLNYWLRFCEDFGPKSASAIDAVQSTRGGGRLNDVVLGLGFDLGESLEAAFGQMIHDHLRPLRLAEPVEHAVDDAADHDRGNRDDGVGQAVVL